jgi:hypothetical protein
MDLVVVSVAATAVGFVLGYAVRAAISRHRRAARRQQIVGDNERSFNLVAPNDSGATPLHRHKDAA